MKTPSLLVFGGSLRAGSYNQKLAAIAAARAEAAGAAVTLVALRDFPLPLFDEDLEQAVGKPAPAARLKQLILDHDALVIASPEYNSSITGALKNAIDWVSRADTPDEKPAAAFAGKSAVILSASPGGYGGKRSLAALRSILGNIGVRVLEDEVAVPAAHHAFDEAGQLIDPEQSSAVERLVLSLIATLREKNPD